MKRRTVSVVGGEAVRKVLGGDGGLGEDDAERVGLGVVGDRLYAK